jgi:hypothetical protein
MSALQAHYDSLGEPVQVLVVDILETMATTKNIQRTYNIYPPCLNDEPGTVWNLYHWDNFIPSNFVIQRDNDQTLFYRAHTMNLTNMIYWIDAALAVGVEESPVTTTGTMLKTPSFSNNRIRIAYCLENTTYTKLVVYDMTGKVVAELMDGVQKSGPHYTSWLPGTNGIYFIKLFTEHETLTDKVVILK